MAKHSTNVTNVSTVGLPLQYERNNAVPLDNTETWISLQNAEDYAKAEKTTAYVGQTLKVIDTNTNDVAVYIIKDINGNLSRLSTEDDLNRLAADKTAGFAYYSTEAEKASGYIRGGEIDHMFKSLQTTIASLRLMITSLQSTVVTQATQITSLQSNISGLSTSVSTLRSDVDYMELDLKDNNKLDGSYSYSSNV